MWMWTLKSPPFLRTISPCLSQSAIRLRSRWLQQREQSQEPDSKGAVDGCSTAGVPPSVQQRRQRKVNGRVVRAAAQSANQPVGAANEETSSSAPIGGSDQNLAVDLDYAPSLGPFREVLCVLLPVLLVTLLYVATAPWHGGSWLANVASVVMAAALTSLGRASWLERAYKARECAFAALGDGDSHFRPIAISEDETGAAAGTATGGGRGRLNSQLVVHVKVKVGDLAPPSAYDGPGCDDGGAFDVDGPNVGAGSSAVGAPGSGGPAAAGVRDSVPAVHCYHGFGANLGSYKRVQDEMAAVLRGVVTAHDMPGFGLTQRPSEMSSYFLTFNGRLGRLVMDYELQQLGLLGASEGQRRQGAGQQPRGTSPVVARVAAAADAAGVAASLVEAGNGVSSVLAAPPRADAGAVPDGVVTMTVQSREEGGRRRQQQQQLGEGAARPRDIKRILVGHSLGGACASLEAVTNPEGLAGLVLVAPAVVALPGPEYQNVTLSPDRPANAAGRGAAVSAAPAAAAAAAARAATQLGSEPPGSHVTDPPEVRRLYPVGQMPAGPANGGSGGGGGGESGGNGRSGGNEVRSGSRRVGLLLRAARALLVAAASLVLLTVLRLLTPVITLLLRSLVRRRTFWEKGLQQAYYNPGAVTQDIVDSYRLPQLVSGWEAGMVNFLLARLSHPRADLRELFRRASKHLQLQPTTTSSVLAATAAAAAADAKREAAAALEPPSSSPGDRGPTRTPDDSSSSSDGPAPGDDSPSDDGDLASRLVALVASRGLPVLIIHGLYDRLVPASNSQRLARMLPGCELVLLDRCGHMPQEELPEIFVSLIAEFATRLTPVPTAHPAPAPAP